MSARERRVVLNIDPSQKATGLCSWELGVGPLDLCTVRLSRAGYAQADSIARLDAMLGDARWAAFLEKSPPRKQGVRNPASEAIRHWKDALDLLARTRAARAGEPFRKPRIFHPQPQTWRSAHSLPTTGVGSTELKRREWMKAQSIARARWLISENPGRLTIDLDALEDDAAEAYLIGAWSSRVLALAEKHPERWVPFGKGKPAVLRWAA